MANVKISDLPIGTPNSTSIFPFVDSGTTYQGAISAITSNGGGVTEVTYSELVDKITGGTLSVAGYYVITNFQTCYDQPDYNENGNPITTGIYKQTAVDPIIVFAINENTISTEAFQPSYPKDKIQYDWTFSATEITQGVAFGRISERIDEYNNRTDYDHRTILFKRYTTYFYDMGNPKSGTIEILDSNGSVTGTSTNFTELGIGNVIKIKDGLNYKVVNVVSDTEMYITGTTINTGSNLIYYLTYAESDNDGSGYPKSYDYKYNNVIDTESRELPTFRIDWELENNGQVKSINNYIGNHSNFWYTNLSHSYFLLANNTFSMYSYSNTLGDRCYNNASYTWFNRNEIAGSFYNNAMWRGFYANIVGEYCNNNIFGGYTWRNKLGEYLESNETFNDFQNNIINNGFNNNIITNEFYKNDIGNGFNHNDIYQDFYGNEIGNAFNGNELYCQFYDNIVGEYYEDNTVGITGNSSSINFYSNKIGNSFDSNEIYSDFYNNEILNNFTSNTIRRWFRNNTIKNNFDSNTTNGFENSDDNEYIGFEGNSIGNDFQNNEISYSFNDNTIGNNFNNNITGVIFEKNNIGNNFNNNKPFNSQLFNWNNLSNLTNRSFRTFQYSLNQRVGRYVVGTEMIMRIISTGQYFRIIFTQWTQGGNGGGFSYNRQEIDSNGNDIGNTVYFTKENYGNQVDVIVEGVLEITRNNNNVIYNVAVEEGPDNDVSPADTEWNSIFTQVTDVYDFTDNLIQNDFQNNNFDGGFGDNIVGNNFNSNDIRAYFNDNTVGNSNTSNEVYLEFYNNKIGNDFSNNSINIDFYDNEIGNNFNNNDTMFIFDGNTIGDSFNDNSIDSQLSGWNNLSNVAVRNYQVWRNSLNNQVGNYILDRQLVMKITSTGQYFKIIFTKWTQGPGGGFSYERTEINSSGNEIGPTVSFTNQNYGYDVDVIVEGVVEITRGDQNGIYNIATEESYNSNTSPADTEWNSIFSQQNADINFTSNIIGNLFNGNNCLGVFAYNTIGDRFSQNTIQDGFGFGNSVTRGNKIGNNFYNNDIGEYFYDNTIIDNFTDNTVSDNFQFNMINTPVSSTTLTSCALYSGLTVNVFRNGNGDNRLSYYDASDVLTIESLTESGCTVISFTINSEDIGGYGSGPNITPNGTNGFDSGPSQTGVGDQEYIIDGGGMSQQLKDDIVYLFQTEGLLTNSTAYVFDVTWANGSTIINGKAMIGYYYDPNGPYYGNIQLSPIDTNNNDWETSGQTISLIPLAAVGTFNFPATFTLYKPVISNTSNWWC